MKQTCMTIFKVTVALILALMMLVGSVSTVIAATVDIDRAESASDSAVTEAAADISEPPAAEVAEDSADDAAPGASSDADAAPASNLADKLVRSVKEDIAAVGANVDLADVGNTFDNIEAVKATGKWSDYGNENSTWQYNHSMTVSSDKKYAEQDIFVKADKEFDFKPQVKFVGDSNWYMYGKNSDSAFTFDTSDTTYSNLVQYNNGRDFKVKTMASTCGYVGLAIKLWGNDGSNSKLEVTQFQPTYTTIYYDNTANKSNVYLYTIKNNSDGAQGAWPGAQIIKDGSACNDDNARFTYTEFLGGTLYRVYIIDADNDGGTVDGSFISTDNSGSQTPTTTLHDGSKYTVSKMTNSSGDVTEATAGNFSLNFWLEGYLEGNNVSNTSDTRKFTQNPSNPDEYTLVYNSTAANQYPVIYDGRNYYHPASNESGSGVAADIYKTATTYGNNDNKWKTSDVSGKIVNYTWNAKTKTLSWSIVSTGYYLTGWLNGEGVSGTSNAFTNTSGDTWTYTFSPSGDQGGYQYMTIKAADGTVYHPASHGAGSGTAGTNTDTSPEGDNKWKVAAVSGDTVDFTWDSSTHVLSWTVTKGSSSSSSWKYTDDHNDATPEWTNSPGDYRFVWANNDDGPGKSGTTAITPGKDSDHGYWADITTYCKSNSNFYFALSNNSANSGIRGNKNEQINDVTQSAGTTVTMTNGSGQTIFYVEMKERSSVSGSANYILVRGVDWTKITAIGVQAYDNSGSYTDYKFYYKEKTAGGEDEVSEATVYAKDGAIVIDWNNKGSSGASTTSGTAYGFSAVADTVFTEIDGQTIDGSSVSISSNVSGKWTDGARVDDDGAGYDTAKIAAGKTIKLTTTIDSDRRSKYYVKGWSINGTTYKCDGTAGVNAASDTNSSTGVCELTYTIPSDLKVDILEITPIYYQRSNSNCVTFYLEGYNTVQEDWGSTPYIYPFYGNENNVDNSFGVYPGQPMVYANGQYSIEIPMTNTKIAKTNGTVAIKGITINNGYADHVHRNLVYMWTDHDNDADHKQTYDYDDFAKIYYECIKDDTEHPNAIYFRIQDESKVYNRSQYGGGKSGQFASGTGNITLSDIESTGNGWELLTNRYGEPINLFGDHSAVSSITVNNNYSTDNANAVYVVSTGYNANIAGDYGTMWKVYNGSGQLISNNGGRQGIPPSLLLLNGTSSAVNPRGAANYLDANRSVDGVGTYSDKHSDYYGVYKDLKASYSNKIVYITYEQNTQDTRKVNTGTGADRVDGRWYYTHKSDNVQSSIEIEVYNKSTGTWDKQTTNASTGADTYGNTAVFNSGSYLDTDHMTTSTSVLISSNSTWSFTATAASGYIFDSWQIKYSDTSYDAMEGTGAAGSIPATANYTLVARFMPVVTGQLTITHALSSSSTGEGNVTMTVTQGSGSAQTATVTNGVARINLTVSNSNTDEVIAVTLTATPLYDGKVKSFSYDSQLTLASDATEANLNTKATAATSTFSFTVGQLYAGTTQTITDLAYVSLIEPTPHYYSFVYNFTDRDGASKSYTSKGEISLKDYKNNVSGEHVISDAFIKSVAPFESNFLKKLTLGSITKTSPYGYNTSTDTFTAAATYSSEDEIPIYNVTFKLPYDYYTSNQTVDGVSYKKYNATPDRIYNSDKATFDLLAKYNEFVTIGATASAAGAQTKVGKIEASDDPNHTGNDFITAPDTLTNGGTTYYFKYWEIMKKADSDQADAPLVSRIYYPDFHYRIFGDYYVEAVYSTTDSDSWHDHYSGGQGYNCSIIYLGDSRNQWNDGIGSSSSGTDAAQAAVAADKIYNDFIFSYNDNGNPLTGASNDLGMILERVIDTTDGNAKWATGNANVSDMSYYQDKYYADANDDDIEDHRAAIQIALNNNTALPTGVLPKIAWNTSELNNKNYTEQNYSFYSAYGQTVEDNSITFATDSTVDNYVYRAYAYMKGSDGNYYVSDPVYFCMRYTANLNYTE